MKQDSSSKKVAGNGGGEGDTGVDAIREVLLGDRLRMYEQRFELLDKTVQSEREALRDSFEQRVNQLEASMNDQLKQMNATVEAERQARADELKGLGGRVDDAMAQLREQLQKLGSDHQAFKGESQREALALSKNLFKELQDRCANLNAYIEEQSTHALDTMAKRHDVAEALRTMAATLVPEGEGASAASKK